MIDTVMKLLIGMHRNVLELDRKTARLAGEVGLTLGQFAVLEVLHSKGDLPVGVVRDCILSSVGTISVIIRNLEQRGLVQRLPDPGDRRVCLLRITPEGEALILKIVPRNNEMIQKFFSSLTAEEQEELLRLMKKLRGKHDG